MKKKRKMKSLTAVLLASAMAFSMTACGTDSVGSAGIGEEVSGSSTGEASDKSSEAFVAAGASLIEAIIPEELGSGTVKWSEEETADGWVKVTNEDGDTLGYSKDSGVSLIQVDGYAFKDLDRDGELDGYEDWRLDDTSRANDLAAHMSGEEIAPLLTHGILFSYGTEISDEDMGVLENGGRAGITRSAIAEDNTATVAAWVKLMQDAAASTSIYGIPLTISIDPTNMSGMANNNSLAATMDQDLAFDIAVEESKQLRAVGVTMQLGPQVDIATTPVWSRSSGSFTEDPALSRDLGEAYISGMQSTFDADGNDLGWGEDSVVSIVKHYAGAGASEGGRNDHGDTGKYTVFQNNNFAAHLIPFFDGAFNLSKSSTKAAGGVMPNYAIAYSEDGSLGDLVGGAYSEYKINMLRDNGYDGFILTDWQITGEEERTYGVEKMTTPERYAALWELGVDQIGGIYLGGSSAFGTTAESVLTDLTAGYQQVVTDMGEEAAVALMREHASRFLLTQIKVDLFENPYCTAEKATSTAWTTESKAYGIKTQEKGIVMLKNSGNAISEYDASAEKPTVYIPYIFAAGSQDYLGNSTASSWELPMDITAAEQYYNVVTDTVGEATGDDGAYTENDIVRASAADIAKCDYAIVAMTSPYTESTTDEDGKYLPASIQYNEYTADTAKQEAIANGVIVKEIPDGYYGYTTEETQEPRSYYGNSVGKDANYADLELLQYVDGTVSDNCKVIVSMTMSNSAMVWSEVEPLADAIVAHYGTFYSDESLLNVISGKTEPNGLLAMQQPASMEAVEAQAEDTPRDVECYVDSEGNIYDFTFGLNWSGVINDERVAKYSAEPLTQPETITFSYAK